MIARSSRGAGPVSEKLFLASVAYWGQTHSPGGASRPFGINIPLEATRRVATLETERTTFWRLEKEKRCLSTVRRMSYIYLFLVDCGTGRGRRPSARNLAPTPCAMPRCRAPYHQEVNNELELYSVQNALSKRKQLYGVSLVFWSASSERHWTGYADR